MKKFLALVLALVMTMSLVTIGANATDVGYTDDAAITNVEAVEVLNALGIMGGYPDGSFRPQANLTRGAGAKLIAYLVLGQKAADKLQATYTVFNDVDDSIGLAAYIEWAAAQGIVDGYGDGTFGPYNTLTQYAFGKMLLGALGYDSAREGFTGAGWQKNVYSIAVKVGVYDGTETYGACNRDTAARMEFGALQAKVVVYGDALVNGAYYWNENRVTVNGIGGVVRDQVIETEDYLYELYGAKLVNTEDVFDRPGHEWSYGYYWSKFYMDAPVAEYKTKVDACQILVDCGYAKTSKYGMTIDYRSTNGTESNYGTSNPSYIAHNNCSGVYGGQGVLTQVFLLANGTYAITEISTYLAKVEDLKAAEHGKIGNDAKLTVYVNDGSTGTTANAKTVYVEDITSLTKGDYILVNVAGITADDCWTYDDYSIYATDMGTALRVVGSARYFEGKLTAVTKPESMALTIDGSSYPAAREYELTATGLTLGANRYWFVDQYGNVIGDALTPAEAPKYGRIDDIVWIDSVSSVKDDEFASANLVTADGSTVNQDVITVDKWGTLTLKGCDNGVAAVATGTVSEVKALNAAYYARANRYGVVKYTGDGSVVESVGYRLYQTIDNESKATNLTLYNKGVELGTFANGAAVYADNDTQFLVYLGYGVYEAYRGISELPTMEGIEGAIAVVEDTVGARAYADFVFVNLPAIYAGATTEAYVFEAKPVAVDYVAGYALYTYNVWVNGEEKPIYSYDGDLFKKATFVAGLFDITFDAYNEAIGAAKCEHYTKPAQVQDAERNGAIDNLYVVGATVYKVGSGVIEAYTTAEIEVGDTIIVDKVSSGYGYASVIYVTAKVDNSWNVPTSPAQG